MNRSLLLLAAIALLAPAVRAAQEGDAPFTQQELEALVERIKPEVEELRGLEFERPVRVAVTDRAGFLAYAQKRIEKTSSVEELAAQGLVGKLCGLLPPDYDLLAETLEVLEEQVGGFYDPADEAFYLMDTFRGDIARVILAHELTHALDDQHFDIDGRIEALGKDSDALFAYHAVVEGSGTSVMNRWMLERMAELDPKALADGGGISMEAVSQAPPYVWKPLIATYLCGAAFLQRSEQVMAGQVRPPSPDDFDLAFRHPPRSSEQVLHPGKFWGKVPGHRGMPPEKVPMDEPVRVRLAAEALPEGWQATYQDTLGELGLALIAEPLAERGGLEASKILGVRFTSDAAAGWGGDRFALLEGPGGACALVGVTVWDDGAQADEFLAALRGLEAHLGAQASALAAARGASGTAVVLERGPLPAGALLVVAAGCDEARARALVAALAPATGE